MGTRARDFFGLAGQWRDDLWHCSNYVSVRFFFCLAHTLTQTGYVAVGGEEYIIEPIKGHPNASLAQPDKRLREHPHLIYKRSALTSADHDDHSNHDDDGHATCGNDGTSSLEEILNQLLPWPWCVFRWSTFHCDCFHKYRNTAWYLANFLFRSATTRQQDPVSSIATGSL